ncbi:putative WRKY transcription factor 40 [Dorcoceras hygrometricum]|uniref:Putative WRKY transcription factor 40 n=1 Tax=Dorcoceras hygrometricum TaxID=472368 RepID=A0A2Z7B8Q9_9LAMI|nr:putative WRKY transcription factor 40 [Dorcoceras hygrometricum]
MGEASGDRAPTSEQRPVVDRATIARRRPALSRHARPARNEVRAAAGHGRPPCAASAHGVARDGPQRGGRLRQSGPRPEGRLLRQPALEGLKRSARTDSPRQVGRNKFRRREAAAARGGDGARRRRRLLREERGRRF